MKQALQDFNIEIVTVPTLKKIQPKAADLWSLIDPGLSNPSSGELKHLGGSEPAMSLPFEVRYQLEVCISREIINEHNITQDFVKKLAEIAAKDSAKARHMLEYVAGQEKRIYEPMSIFEDLAASGFSSKTDIPHYCAYSRKATITPSTIYFSTPTVETTNRVLRHYARENKDGRFLRVQFTDELFEVFDISTPSLSELILIGPYQRLCRQATKRRTLHSCLPNTLQWHPDWRPPL
jgi:RNA-dependent RNA polymerase